MDIKTSLHSITQARWALSPDACDNYQLYVALQQLAQERALARTAPQGKRKLYYFSAEFLMGKLLSNNLLALGIYEDAAQLLAEMGKSMSEIEDCEPEPSLGNGGLGRLAACFLDSIAALGLPGDGVGLNYHYGLFRQKFSNNLQHELPDFWLEADNWLVDTGISFTVPFGGFSLTAVLKDLVIPGAHRETANRLHLFDVAEPAAAPSNGIAFDKHDISHALTSFLYPDDSDDTGRLLRVYQQYFMVSAGAQLILKELDARGGSIDSLSEHVVIQINDTHPSMVIPELIRLLCARGMSMDAAIAQVRRTCAYTNHTILAEALEKWPISSIETVAPQLVPIIRELDARLSGDSKTAIIDKDNRVHMAHMDIHYGYSINGVAALHSQILAESELNDFYQLYPEKFGNKTNGITLRRWLEGCNPRLSALLTQYISEDWKHDPTALERLLPFKNDAQLLNSLLTIKLENKKQLFDAIAQAQGIELNPNSIFDIQIKRLHEYKRQQMNLLYVIHKYLEIRAGKYPTRPITIFFGGKAAPAYKMAKNIIHLVLCLRDLIANDPTVSPWLRVVMIENYNVSWAQLLIPACDISEQISLASKEASGTGNMKFMANGAVTLGTMDGANVEIAQLVGEENIYTFGASSQTVIDLYARNGYEAASYYFRPRVKHLVDFIVSPELSAYGDIKPLYELAHDLQTKDWFMALLDIEDYIDTRDRAYEDFERRIEWAQKSLVNIAKSGFFSSDRTIAQYNEDIWHL